ncbi:MAG: response regulator [Sulfuricurvum sp.]|nr:response regulator [Sulfuricurvum sp.]
MSTDMEWPADTRILLVEDNHVNQVVALEMLKLHGLNADVASNGYEALEALDNPSNAQPYTLILMDCEMPEMDGFQATLAIRSQKGGKQYQNIPIIAMTANAMNGDREKCIRSGMNDYISKPIDMDILKETLQKWIQEEINQSNDTFVMTGDLIEEKLSWDKEGALRRLGGKNNLLIRVLRIYSNDAKPGLEKLKLAIEAGDLKTAQLSAHALKGSSGNISASRIQMLAEQIEKNANINSMHTLNGLIIELEKEIDHLLFAISSYIEEYEGKEVNGG